MTVIEGDKAKDPPVGSCGGTQKWGCGLVYLSRLDASSSFRLPQRMGTYPWSFCCCPHNRLPTLFRRSPGGSLPRGPGDAVVRAGRGGRAAEAGLAGQPEDGSVPWRSAVGRPGCGRRGSACQGAVPVALSSPGAAERVKCLLWDLDSLSPRSGHPAV